MPNPAIAYTRIKKVHNTRITEEEDALAAEEPLEIRLLYGPAHNRKQQSITVTMRTPGEDTALVTGFLFTEGIITSASDISTIHFPEVEQHAIAVSLHEHVQPVLQSTQRNFYSNSGCGVCGKTELASIYTSVDNAARNNIPPVLTFPATRLLALPDALRRQQLLFNDTGGLHAAALFNEAAELLLLREDIGRHNAVDKLVGAALSAGIPLHHSLMLLSGRAGFELIQKAAMANIPIVAAVGAPSSLAVRMAQQWNITLVGFLRQQRCNIYTNEHRIIM
ncbi:formate dehydrogenase accessory sulfurtransferase FdhD [uncultured Chitinophaga sp.]|jgi:formate dehydrogenase family accessory protein FdhD|uniref:formate dehydrogenase accessory sulfurtransferase FdhD n=1 Tax=uncultured Chitinophaga sp. TaxID=339340 RepID=UPI00260E5C8D|nr:formate dehydrogenase accessory sulfurtransferase FdhD [uncultured Chitinophaga sp.]